MIKIHHIEKDIKSIAQKHFQNDKLDVTKADTEITAYLEKIKSNYHHVEYDVSENEIKLLLYTSADDGFNLSFKVNKKITIKA